MKGDEIPDPRDHLIIGLAEACDLWIVLTEEASLASARPRIDLHPETDFHCHAVARAAREDGPPGSRG